MDTNVSPQLIPRAARRINTHPDLILKRTQTGPPLRKGDDGESDMEVDYNKTVE